MLPPLLQLILLACCAEVEDSYLSDHAKETHRKGRLFLPTNEVKFHSGM